MDNRIELVLDAFESFLNQDKYISRKDYDLFLDNNLNVLLLDDNIKKSNNYFLLEDLSNNGYSRILKHNQNYISHELVNKKEYFDNLFLEIDSNIMLDEEQRKAILCDEDYSLVVAGAGSGKTTTMSAKAKYLVEQKNIDPKRILLLSFTNKAAEELDYRVNEEFKLGIDVFTFHKLGMKFIRKIFDKPVSICSDKTLYNVIDKYFREQIFPNKYKLKRLREAFLPYINIDDKAFMFSNFEEFFDWSYEKSYEANKNNLDKVIKEIILRREKNNVTILGDLVKSNAEVKIANFLHLNSIRYEYEKKYPNSVGDNHSYLPDFTVFNGELEYYIEFYGMTKRWENGRFTLDDISLYNKLIKKKRELHNQYGTDLIELYYKDEFYSGNNAFLEKLEFELKKRNISFVAKTNEEIYRDLYYSAKTRHYFKFIELIKTFINNFKNKGYLDKDFDYLINNEKDIIVKEQLKIAREIYNYYEKYIHNRYFIDFNDMINYAYWGIDRIDAKSNSLKYDYIIVDEYQDISFVRYQLLKKLSILFDSKIVAVGDDWQAIFAFSGSDINMFTDFCHLMGYGEILKITNTYRNSQELIDVSGEFVLQNEGQLEKRLFSNKRLENPVVLKLYDEDEAFGKIDVLINILEEIHSENPKQKILLLGRFKNDIDEFLESKKFKRSFGDKIVSLNFSDLNMDFLTVHSSKGLGYDQVILLNALNSVRGFPAKIEDDYLIKLLSPLENEFIEYPEERRLFYVALTRTKNKVYILTPNKRGHRSEFVLEIENYDNVIYE